MSEDPVYDPATNSYIHQPKNVLKIEEIWAYVSVDPKDGNEGIIGSMMPNGMWVPFIGADEHRMRSLRPMVEGIRKRTAQDIRLVRFTHKTVMETL